MARKSAAERQAEQQAKRLEMEAFEWSELAKTYAERFARLMFEYSTKPRAVFKVTRTEDPNVYLFESWQDWSDEFTLPARLPSEYNEQLIMDLASAERALNRAEEVEAEENRRRQLKASALAKLTEEERQILELK